jgi:hypothetical protein
LIYSPPFPTHVPGCDHTDQFISNSENQEQSSTRIRFAQYVKPCFLFSQIFSVFHSSHLKPLAWVKSSNETTLLSVYVYYIQCQALVKKEISPNGLELICGGYLLDWVSDELGTKICELQNIIV